MGMIRLENIEYDNCKRGEWNYLIDAIDSGEIVKIHESIYDYFLNVLPPRGMTNNGFYFAEGMEHIRYFYHIKKDYFVIKTNTMNSLD